MTILNIHAEEIEKTRTTVAEAAVQSVDKGVLYVTVERDDDGNMGYCVETDSRFDSESFSVLESYCIMADGSERDSIDGSAYAKVFVLLSEILDGMKALEE